MGSLRVEKCSKKSEDGPFQIKKKKKRKHAGVNNGDILNLSDLLFTQERDFLVKYNHQQEELLKVKAEQLADKFIVLYFASLVTGDSSLREDEAFLSEIYTQLYPQGLFEVVFVYISNSWQTFRTTEETFWKAFKTMPWLALPFKDPNCIKLQRMFDYPPELSASHPNPSLVIIGPHGNFIEPFGADIFIKFGCPAYPFTSQRAAELLAKKASKVKLEMFWDPNTVFKRKSGSAEGGSQVQISQLVGKKIIILFEDSWLKLYPMPMKMLKEMYSQMKGTDNEFEVIQVFYSKRRYSYYKHGASLPWLMWPCFKMGCDVKEVLYSVFPSAADVKLLAFDKEGTVVRIASKPAFEKDADFTFYNGDMRKEVLMELRSEYSWDYSSDDDI